MFSVVLYKSASNISVKHLLFLFVHTNIIIYISHMGCSKDNKYCGCLYYSTNALSRIITKMAEEEFSITQLAPSYAFLLMIINEKPGSGPKEISQKMMLTPSTVTRLIEKMEGKGYVSRKINGKFTEVYPTQKSTEIDNKIREAWVNLFKRYEELLGNETSKQLTNDIYDAALKLQTE